MSAPRETVQTHCEKLRCFVDYIDSPYALLGRGLGPLVGEGKAESRESTGTGGGGRAVAVAAVGGERAVTCAIY